MSEPTRHEISEGSPTLSLGLLRALEDRHTLRPAAEDIPLVASPRGSSGEREANGDPIGRSARIADAFGLDRTTPTPVWIGAARFAGYPTSDLLDRFRADPSALREELALDQLALLRDDRSLDRRALTSHLGWELLRIADLPAAYPEMTPYLAFARESGLDHRRMRRIRERAELRDDPDFPVCDREEHLYGQQLPSLCNDNSSITVAGTKVAGISASVGGELVDGRAVDEIVDPAMWPCRLPDFWLSVDVVTVDELPTNDALTLSRWYEIEETVVLPGGDQPLPAVRLTVGVSATAVGRFYVMYDHDADQHEVDEHGDEIDFVAIDVGHVSLTRLCRPEDEQDASLVGSSFQLNVQKYLRFGRDAVPTPDVDAIWQMSCLDWIRWQERFGGLALGDDRPHHCPE